MLFLYLDESGNYTFSKDGSEYLIYTSLATTNPYAMYSKFCELEKDLKNRSIQLESGYFHASEDKQAVRNDAFKILREIDCYDIDSIIVEKCKANPSIRDVVSLYRKVYGILLQYVFRRYSKVDKILIFLDEAPNQKKKHAIEKGIKETLSELLGKDKIGKDITYHMTHLPSVFSYGLQAADYCCWALKKKWGDWENKSDIRPYNEIAHRVKSQLDIFERGDGTKYY